jgi:microcystin-dependent protein
MASFRISTLRVSEVLDGSSFVPATITQNSTFYSDGSAVSVPTTVTRKLSIQNLRTWFDSGVYKQMRSGVSVKVTPENFTTSGTISFNAPGFTALYAGLAEPNGWYICNGRSLSVAEHPDLFSVIAYTYGGSGANFNLPNLSGRTVFGLDDMGSTAAGRTTVEGSTTLGAMAGFAQHTLLDSQAPLVSHTHSATGTFAISAGANRTGNNDDLVTGAPRKNFNTSSGGCARTLSLSIENSSNPINASETQPHPNLPPFLLLNWIIKY